MTRNILVLKSSPRARGNSSLLADALIRGAIEAGAKVDQFSMRELKIQPCDGCDACHNQPGSGCVIDDDMQMIYPMLKQADALVLASPVYWFTYSAQLKLVVDRFYALEGPEGNTLKGKQVAVILTYGDSNEKTSGAINAIHAFEDMFSYIRAPIVEVLHASASDEGDIEKNPEMMQRAAELGRKLATGN
jgi:multimeric flavodoxin WrbA